MVVVVEVEMLVVERATWYIYTLLDAQESSLVKFVVRWKLCRYVYPVRSIPSTSDVSK